MTRSDRPLRTPRVPRLRRASGEVVPDAAPPQQSRQPEPPRLAPAPGRAKTPAARGAHALEVVQQPMPGHLYLDPDVPADEVIDPHLRSVDRARQPRLDRRRVGAAGAGTHRRRPHEPSQGRLTQRLPGREGWAV
ncbi:MAG: hypothetical protein PGN11_07910 [Quadrisphaera sp.]